MGAITDIMARISAAATKAIVVAELKKFTPDPAPATVQRYLL